MALVCRVTPIVFIIRLLWRRWLRRELSGSSGILETNFEMVKSLDSSLPPAKLIQFSWDFPSVSGCVLKLAGRFSLVDWEWNGFESVSKTKQSALDSTSELEEL